ncbi:MAG: hypothetical protein GY866_11110 [Proteobacteria bacterium]|nr:hypothetical protein [Pseudomonadota bacterium]
MAESIAQQVIKVLERNPDIGNQELYAAFPRVRKNTLRHYKSKFGKTTITKASGKSKVSAKKPVKQAAGKARISVRKAEKPDASVVKKSKKPAASKKTIKSSSKTDLENRIRILEEQVRHLTETIERHTPATEVIKSSISAKTEGLDKRVKELEENILHYIKEKRDKVKSEMSSLDELQQIVTNKITAFVSSLKSRP